MLISELKLSKELIRKASITPKDAGAINILAKNLRGAALDQAIDKYVKSFK